MPTTVSDYYHTLESRVGYRLILGGTRHFGYYEAGTLWPFPISSALQYIEECLYQTLGLADNTVVLDAGTGNSNIAIYIVKKDLKIKAINIFNIYIK